MSRDRMDIVLELMELSREIMADVKHQLNYYRASVYKHETANQINEKIEQLKTIALLVNDDLLMEPFEDYEATIGNGNVAAIPGECIFSSRVAALLQSLDAHWEDSERVAAKEATPARDLARNIQKNRHKLLKMCRHGTRQWAFFKSL